MEGGAPLSRCHPGCPGPAAGPAVSVKLETVQPTGSFKVRGGLAAVAATSRPSRGESPPPRPATTGSVWPSPPPSSGPGSRWSSRPEPPPPRSPRCSSSTSRLVLHGEGYREAETHALELAAHEGGRYVSPYNDADVIAGQSTLAGAARAGARRRHRRGAMRGRWALGRPRPRPGRHRASTWWGSNRRRRRP